MGRLGPRDDALGPRELDTGLKCLVLRVRSRLHVPVLHQHGERRGVAVIAKPARMHRRGHEGVAERVHGDQRRHLAGIAEVVRELTAREGGTGRGLRRDERGVELAGQLVAHEGIGEPGVIRTTAHAADDEVGLLTRHLHLLLRLEPDHRLMEQHVVQDAAERIVRVVVRGRHLDGLADRDPE